MKIAKYLTYLFILITMILLNIQTAAAQKDARKFRIARIEVFPRYVDQYKTAPAEHAKTAVQAEPGVLTLQAVYDQANPAQVMVFEVYASEAAYQMHLKTSHFLKYKNGTLKMVKSLELIEVEPIAIAIKPELSETEK